MKNNIFKRICAYLIDFLVVTFISMGLASISFINPRYDKYKEISNEYSQILNDYYDKKMEVNEFNEKVKDISYDMNKNGYVYIIGDIVIAFLYFGFFQFVTKGQTLGKKIMNIKVVSNKDGKELKIHNYFVRTFILNGIILNIFIFIAVWFSRSTYYKIYNVGSSIDYILMIAIFMMVMFSSEGRGFHDVLAGTKVIDLSYQNSAKVESEFLDHKKEEVEVIVPKSKGQKKKSTDSKNKKDN